MANADLPFGFLAIDHTFGGKEQRLSRYTIASGAAVNIFRGDAVIASGTGRGITAMTAKTEPVQGVFSHVEYVDSNGVPQKLQKWTSGTTAKSGTTVYAYLWDDPATEFAVQAGGTVAAADIGTLQSVYIGNTGDSVFNQSRQEITSQGSDVQVQILGIFEDFTRRTSTNGDTTGYVDNDYGANVVLRVKFANHVLGGTALGQAV